MNAPMGIRCPSESGGHVTALELYYHDADGIRSGTLSQKNLRQLETILDDNMSHAIKTWNKKRSCEFWEYLEKKLDKVLDTENLLVYQYTLAQKVLPKPCDAKWYTRFVLTNKEKKRVVVAEFARLKGCGTRRRVLLFFLSFLEGIDDSSSSEEGFDTKP